MSDIAAVIIGRNEGERLVRGLAALQGKAAPIVYVDSNSSDGSVANARAVGAEVVTLDLSKPFTAARARNAGLARLAEIAPGGDYVQILDGDTELRDGWLEAGRAALDAAPDLAVVFGRRRERFPEASIWNRLADAEWDGPPGEVLACGGDALFRRAALDAVGGYRESMIAGEEPELCQRFRRKGWRIERLAAEMTWHDAGMTRIGQWWKRAERGGHAYAEDAAIHGRGPDRFRVAETRRALIWGAGIPLAAVLGALLLSPWALLVLLAWPLQVIRLRLRGLDWTEAFFLTFGKLPEAKGVLSYWWNRARGRRRRLIEYK